MASTETESVEEHQRATRPVRTPAPGIHRALACVALAAIRPIDPCPAWAGASKLQPFAGLALIFPLATLRRPIRIQGDHPISTACRPGSQARLHRCLARARIGQHGPSARPGRLTTPRKRRRLAVDPAGRLQHQAR